MSTTINYQKRNGNFSDNIREKDEILKEIIHTIKQDSFGVGKDILAAIDEIIFAENLTENEVNEYIEQLLQSPQNQDKEKDLDEQKELHEKDKELKKYLNIIQHLTQLQQNLANKLNFKMLDVINLIISKIIAKIDVLIKSNINIDIITQQHLKNINQILAVNKIIQQTMSSGQNMNDILQMLSKQIAMQNQQLKQSHNQNIIAGQNALHGNNQHQSQVQKNGIDNLIVISSIIKSEINNINESKTKNGTLQQNQANIVDIKIITALMSTVIAGVVKSAELVVKIAKTAIEEVSSTMGISIKNEIEMQNKNNKQTLNQGDIQAQQAQNNANFQQANQVSQQEEEEIDFDAKFNEFNQKLTQTNQQPKENKHQHESGCPCCSGHSNFKNDDMKLQTQIKEQSQKHQQQEHGREHNLQHQLLIQK